jgi:beta-lactamase regulating signal transducer with metallopeptidase domain
MPSLDFLREPAWQRLTASLLHFLWQGLAIAVLLQLLLPLLHMRRAGTRYAVCVAAMLLMAACVPVTFCLLPSGAAPIPDAMDGALLPPRGLGENGAAASPTLRPSVAGGRTEPDGTWAWPVRLAESLRSAQPYLLSAWLLGVLVLSSRILFGLVSIPRLLTGRAAVGPDLAARLKRLSEGLGLLPNVRVFASRRVGEAVVFGFVRPIILVPLSWLAEMTPDVLEAVLAHELAHIRRCDLWVNLFQRTVETLLFYHPSVWWLSRRIRLERETCCDDLAVAATGRRLDYATALEFAGRKRASLAAVQFESVSGRGKMALLERIHHILGLLPERNRIAWWPVGLAVVATVLLLAACLAHDTGRAVTTEPSTHRTSAQPHVLPQQVSNDLTSQGFATGAALLDEALRLTIRCEGELLKVGDEIPIEVAIANCSPEDLEYCDHPDGSGVHAGQFGLAAFDQHGRAVPDSSAATPEGSEEQATTRAVLRPGQSWARTVALNRWALITQAGKYRVVGTFTCPAKSHDDPTIREIRSAPITITVHPRSQHERAEHIQRLRRSLSAAQDQTASNELAWKLVYACDPWLVASLSDDIRMSDRPAEEGSPRERPKSAANLHKSVTLKRPYAVRFQGKEVTELPVFGATILICQQAGIPFNFERSLNEGDPMCMRMVSPEFADVPASKALEELLGRQELTYEIDDDGLFLKPITATRWEPNLRRRVALRQPYDPRYQPSPRGQLSVQHAVAAVCGQAGIPYDWDRSYKATDPLCRNWVTPEFLDLNVRTALERILRPVGLAYGIDAKGVYLKLKQRPGSAKAEPKVAVRKGQVLFGAPPTGLQPANTLTQQERVENFETLAEAIGKYYAMFKIKSIDWGEVVGRYRTKLDKAKTTEEFYFLLFQLVNELRDTHSWLQNWRPTVLASRPELGVEPFGDRAYVTSVPAGSEPQQKGVEIGSEILAVDGAAVADRLKQIEPQLKSLSSQRAFTREAFASLLSGDQGTDVKVKLRSPKDKVFEVVLPRTVRRVLPPEPSYGFQVKKRRFVHHGTHPSGFGYVRVLSFDGREEIADEFDKALEELRETPGLIVDIRDNPGGFGNAQPRMVGRFIRQRTLVAVGFQRSEPAPAELARRETYFAPTGPWQYLKPVVLLVNENTGSAADLFACSDLLT